MVTSTSRLNSKLETYLTTLEHVLKPFSVSDRAEIVMEIKSHVLSAMERDPQADIESVLSAMGPAETVANRYLMERGLKPTKPSISPVVRWLVFGFLGTCALLALAISFAIVKLSPLIKVDEEKGRVVLLGGMIDIQSTPGSSKNDSESESETGDDAVVSIAGVQLRAPLKGLSTENFSGSTQVKASQEIYVHFNNGKLAVKGTSGNTLIWNCTVQKRERKPNLQILGPTLQLDLRDWDGMDCSIQVPEHKLLRLRGNNGWIKLSDLRSSVDTKLINGNIEFNPAKDALYTYDVSVQTGVSDVFTNSMIPPGGKSTLIKLSVTNGKISH